MRPGRVAVWLFAVTAVVGGLVALAVANADHRTQEVVASRSDQSEASGVPSLSVSDDVASFLVEPMAFMDALLHEQAEQTEACLTEAGVPANAIDRSGLVNPDWEPPAGLDSDHGEDLSPPAVACLEALKSNEARLSEGVTLASKVLALGVDETGARTSRTDELASSARNSPSPSGASLYEEVVRYVQG